MTSISIVKVGGLELEAEGLSARLALTAASYCWAEVQEGDWEAVLRALSSGLADAATAMEDATEATAELVAHAASGLAHTELSPPQVRHHELNARTITSTVHA
eukprot:scaffold624482_cov36-Prasinocladus_malaysianus.AAC.1